MIELVVVVCGSVQEPGLERQIPPLKVSNLLFDAIRLAAGSAQECCRR
jgi:hypothetical protein